MDSYNYFVSGFVKEVGATVFSNMFTCWGGGGGVSHSQMLSETPPTAWVIAEMGGKVLSAHCNCMAGLGEACSHIGVILFIVGLQPRKRTQLLLLGRKHIGFCLQTRKSVSDIDFSCPNTSETNVPGPEIKKEVPSSTPTEIELQDIFGKLSLSEIKQAILTLVHAYNQSQSKKFTLKL